MKFMKWAPIASGICTRTAARGRMRDYPSNRKITMTRWFLWLYKKAALALFACAASSLAAASNFEGVIAHIAFTENSSSPRVSINVGPRSSSCSDGQWFVIDNADTGVRKMWVAALLAAHLAGKPVFIEGNLICNIYGNEGVARVDVR